MHIGIVGRGVSPQQVQQMLVTLETERADREYQNAKNALEQAQHNFNHAEPRFVAQAVWELGNAEDRVNIAIRKLKLIRELNTYE